MGQQARSRAVVIQVPENQDSCPQQVFETRPCKGLWDLVVSGYGYCKYKNVRLLREFGYYCYCAVCEQNLQQGALFLSS